MASIAGARAERAMPAVQRVSLAIIIGGLMCRCQRLMLDHEWRRLVRQLRRALSGDNYDHTGRAHRCATEHLALPDLLEREGGTHGRGGV